MREEDGQGMVEYALIIAGVAAAAVVAVGVLGPKLKVIFNGLDLPAAAVE
ncbi:MAG: Flp family type IVb pilin [Desulfitobacteriaceae bacterium]|nr:Flp family type IVb pilin [Desulfitobacteriaceae bacterium]